VTPQVEGPLASLHGGGRGRPKDTIDRPHCCWSVKLLAATPALKIKGWRGEQTGRQTGRQAGKQQVGRGQSLALGDARGVCGIYPACEELLHVYPATQREALAAERGRWPMRQCVPHWKDAHPAASSVMATSATARSSANNRQPTPPPPPNSSSSNRERAEQGRRGDAGRKPRSTFLPVLRKITSENFENRLLFQGASLIEAMRRCPLSNG